MFCCSRSHSASLSERLSSSMPSNRSARAFSTSTALRVPVRVGSSGGGCLAWFHGVWFDFDSCWMVRLILFGSVRFWVGFPLRAMVEACSCTTLHGTSACCKLLKQRQKKNCARTDNLESGLLHYMCVFNHCVRPIIGQGIRWLVPRLKKTKIMRITPRKSSCVRKRVDTALMSSGPSDTHFLSSHNFKNSIASRCAR